MPSFLRPEYKKLGNIDNLKRSSILQYTIDNYSKMRYNYYINLFNMKYFIRNNSFS